MIVEQFVEQALRDRASDIHLVQGLTPRYRVNGEIREMCSNCLTAEDCLTAAMELAEGDFRRAETVGEADLALTIAGVRCRINLFRQRGGWSAAIRLLNDHIPDLGELGLPKAAAEFPAYGQGLVLISGETGSGKSTTLAAVLNRINHSERKHILTLEDPIEYVYTPDKCVINQREIRRDTASFASGLRAALREDPDVILVGEMRDLETIETALTAAETGHLVFGTVHTNSAA
ncbi:ATPase, T2SS/T4P/T4SS family, partial [uncultured Oscillibacter sp.]|uniref:type IV pilus twitching motility protein PilT n=1 Tax=uncultured Oscillibacter sp. TaxID=876091 RepID=UPI0026214B2B